MSKNLHIQRAATCQAVCALAAHAWTGIVQSAIAQRGACYIALSGGRTPVLFYQALLQLETTQQIDWAHVHLFLGDERCVPPDHPDSNYRMTEQSLLTNLPRTNIYPVNTALSAEQAAAAYAERLQQTVPVNSQGIPEFDVIMLGMGGDGHTASLFPGTAAVAEQQALVVAVTPLTAPHQRISITFPLINTARHVMLLVCGEDKARVVHEIFHANHGSAYPVQHVKPVEGHLYWYLDAAAADFKEDIA